MADLVIADYRQKNNKILDNIKQNKVAFCNFVVTVSVSNLF